MLTLPFPTIDPVIFQVGAFAVRWYALAYIAGILAGAWYLRRLVTYPPALMSPAQVDDFFLWALGGVILGGRLGYVLFYKTAFYLANPVDIFKTWEGGMSFHGGLLGVTAAIILFARQAKVDKWYLADGVACVAPVGIALGRLANFINGELWGRPAPDLPWAMVFPNGGPLPRHPSQLYQAALEGLLLLAIVNLASSREAIRHKPGWLNGIFWMGYGLFRIVGEFFREPDSFMGFFIGGTTMGQWLSFPMVAFGAYSIWRAERISRRT